MKPISVNLNIKINKNRLINLQSLFFSMFQTKKFHSNNTTSYINILPPCFFRFSLNDISADMESGKVPLPLNTKIEVRFYSEQYIRSVRTQILDINLYRKIVVSIEKFVKPSKVQLIKLVGAVCCTISYLAYNKYGKHEYKYDYVIMTVKRFCELLFVSNSYEVRQYARIMKQLHIISDILEDLNFGTILIPEKLDVTSFIVIEINERKFNLPQQDSADKNSGYLKELKKIVPSTKLINIIIETRKLKPFASLQEILFLNKENIEALKNSVNLQKINDSNDSSQELKQKSENAANVIQIDTPSSKEISTEQILFFNPSLTKELTDKYGLFLSKLNYLFDECRFIFFIYLVLLKILWKKIINYNHMILYL
jgi:hypothetical protein